MERKVICTHPDNVTKDDLQFAARQLREIFKSHNERIEVEKRKADIIGTSI